MPHKLWFKAKRYGWGWYPSGWEGWLVTLLAIALMVFVDVRIDGASHSVSDTLMEIVLPNVFIVAVLIVICFLTGEQPRWRWGK